MEETNNENVENLENVERVNEQNQKENNKKITFTLVYILVGLVILAVLGMLIYSFIVTR